MAFIQHSATVLRTYCVLGTMQGARGVMVGDTEK